MGDLGSTPPGQSAATTVARLITAAGKVRYDVAVPKWKAILFITEKTVRQTFMQICIETKGGVDTYLTRAARQRAIP